ncbi:hypothetical protein C427_0508 [Paraglaciecola psychrophila 170]|uniref:Uncharacterized protein n=1 Tax=Paraglaciecola psychrophila 170 TaxID=1129794 RepID=K6Z1F6_9ALTE|nr:hypothetical protein C427_0508 [Paraglaciecola psychrophila 170]GAC38869.1 hypothetical protein GPSY_3258 [Paraglaciecola psychrophila 170]
MYPLAYRVVYEVFKVKYIQLMLIIFSANCFAQSTPSEMAEMSLQ